MPKMTEDHKIAMRNQFLDSAEKVFQERGYAKTKIDDIVRASGSSKGLIYLYFKSKDDLFEGLQK